VDFYIKIISIFRTFILIIIFDLTPEYEKALTVASLQYVITRPYANKKLTKALEK